MTEQERFMKEAVRQARKAASIGEVPIGCVIVHEGKIIARGYNRRTADKNTLAHAELQAIKKASKINKLLLVLMAPTPLRVAIPFHKLLLVLIPQHLH